MIEWNNMTNTDIRMKMSSMKEEYEAIKNKINNLLSNLDTLDTEYLKAQKVLEERSKK
jgi:hypothetical protein